LPDRLTREALLDARNLRAVVREVAPDVADRLDYDDLELLPPPYPLDDWRHRDNDFQVRLRSRDGSREILVCVLVERQSSEDPVMPLRLLVYAGLYRGHILPAFGFFPVGRLGNPSGRIPKPSYRNNPSHRCIIPDASGLCRDGARW
jgi:hypothetical protein